MSVYRPEDHIQDQWLDVERCYLIFCILQVVSVGQSGGLSMEIGVLYLSHAMLDLAVLTVCSTRGFACILAKWIWPTVTSLSLTYGCHEASCNKRADTYFGRQSASLIKVFWTLCILLMTDSETVMAETIPYSNIGLTDRLWICKMVARLGPHFFVDQYP